MENCILQCYESISQLAWVAIEYIYLLSLQVAAFVLAILNRKVKIKVLNDSKEMLIIVYSTSAIMVVLGVLTFGVDGRIVVFEVLFSGLVMVATTIFLTFVFVPKVSEYVACVIGADRELSQGDRELSQGMFFPGTCPLLTKQHPRGFF